MSVQKLRPFHETIVDAITTATSSQLVIIRTILKTTVIPKDWDIIIAAWQERCKDMRFDDEGVIAHLEAEKVRVTRIQALQEIG
ncbi:MAG: hypothetical protein AAB664_01695 [Patescibacteria group bacterium]